ncbi:hypothetical protein ASZ90_016225 [hydrocarbon metagenome]|uniref:Uncharacterized protein n=1 Tax=hydrocarbon metagenome TaxID=938273 RepID=A0A0W8EZT2_9ZZZZ
MIAPPLIPFAREGELVVSGTVFITIDGPEGSDGPAPCVCPHPAPHLVPWDPVARTSIFQPYRGGTLFRGPDRHGP